jgi:putative endonuclease
MDKQEHRESLGEWGEREALGFLQQSGMSFVDRNFHCTTGEVDLIMQEGEILVFVEVKTRRSLRFGAPEESITKTKLARMYQTALAYLDITKQMDREWRMDVVAIVCDRARRVTRMDHYANLQGPLDE